MKFKEFLEKRETNLSEISKICNIPYATLHNGIRNPQKMNLENFNKISNYFDIKKDILYKMLIKENGDTLLSILLDQKSSKLKGNIYHFTQINLTYNSNRIEGSELSEEETRLIFDTNTLDKKSETTNVDDIIETSNSFYLFDLMLSDANKLLSEELLRKYHRVLKNGTTDSRKEWFNVGDYKLLSNEVGGKKTTAPKDVEKEMIDLLKWYNSIPKVSIEDIIEFHYLFESIHPFQDGNGRIGRLIIFKECLKHNIVPFIIEDNSKMYYYRRIKEYKNEKGYLIDTCLTMQDKYRKNIEKYLKSHYDIKNIL